MPKKSRVYTQVSTTLANDYYNRFQQMYPRCAARFLRLCCQKAVESPIFFQRVFFGELTVDDFRSINFELPVDGSKFTS